MRSQHRRHAALREPSALRVEQLEERRLLSVTANWQTQTNTLVIVGTSAADQIFVRARNGFVQVENQSGSVVHWSGASPHNVTPTMVQRVDIAGTNDLGLPDGSDTISVAEMTSANGFSNFASATLTGGGGNDSLVGGPGADLISGNDGNDTLIAGIGNDTLVAGAGDDLFRTDMTGAAANITTVAGPGNDSLTVNMPAGTSPQAVSIDNDSVNISGGAIFFQGLVRLQLHTADGADTVNVFQPEVGSLPSQVQIVTNGGNDSITLLTSSTPLETEFAIHGGIGANVLEVRGTAVADYFEMTGSTLETTAGSQVLVSDIAQLVLNVQGGNDQVVLRDTTLTGSITVLGGADADRIELTSPDAGSFLLSGENGDDTIVVRAPLASGTSVHGGAHTSGDVLDLSHNGLSAANLPVQIATMETVDLSYNAFVEAPNLPLGVVTADFRYNSLAQLNRLAAVTTLRQLLLHGNSNSPDFASLRGRLYKTDLPAVGLEKAERLPNAQDALMEVARALHFSPLEIYEYVLNNYDFQAYAGLMKGVRGTLLTHAGNAWDLSELLIGLLNAAGTSMANMSFSTARVVVPYATARAWLGVETDTAALKVLQKAELRQVSSTTLGGFVIDHAWVAANFAGVGGPAAIGLDASWKFREYRTGVPDIFSQLPISATSPSLETEYLATLRTQLPHEWYEDRIAEYLRQHHPGMGLADVSRNGPVRVQSFDGLPELIAGFTIAEPAFVTTPAVLPYSQATAYRSLHNPTGPELFTHRVQITLSGATPITRQVRHVAFAPIFITWSIGSAQILDQTYSTYVPILHIGSETITLPVEYNDLQVAGFEPRIAVTIGIFNPGNDHTAPNANANHASQYLRKPGTVMAIGISANQTNDVTLAEQQAVLNDYANTHNTGTFGQIGIGQLLAQSAATYYRRQEQCALSQNVDR